KSSIPSEAQRTAKKYLDHIETVGKEGDVFGLSLFGRIIRKGYIDDKQHIPLVESRWHMLFSHGNIRQQTEGFPTFEQIQSEIKMSGQQACSFSDSFEKLLFQQTKSKGSTDEYATSLPALYSTSPLKEDGGKEGSSEECMDSNQNTNHFDGGDKLDNPIRGFPIKPSVKKESIIPLEPRFYF
ncbi:hypothetical protein ADUPG1_000752, partial [Aduncisulcus paluster]